MKKLLLSLFLLTLPLLVSAYDAYIDGIYYSLIPKGNVAEVTYGETKYSVSVTIPEKFTYEGVAYSVTSIGERAFYGCWDLSSITIPNSVTTIGYDAFYGCNRLNKVIVKDIATWCSISFSSFNNPLSYAHHLFSDENTEITDLVIPNSVTSIGNYAFSGCSSLTSVTIPNSVTTIGGGAFYQCNGLTSVTIPNSVFSVGEFAFYECSSLTSVTIPNSVTSIGRSAFHNCSCLTSTIIPNSVTFIGSFAFHNCTSLSTIKVEEGNKVYDSRDNCNAIILTNSNNLIKGCNTSFIPNSVTSIGRYAFYGCSGITSIIIPGSVSSIGSGAFAYCNKLEEVYCYMEDLPYLDTDGHLFTADSDNPDNENPFTKTYPQYITLYVPSKLLNDYKTTFPWSEFGTILPIGGYDYNLTYIIDGYVYKSYTLKEGDDITIETPPIKEGYTFSGWSEIPTTMPASDVIVTGSFTVNKYKLTYCVDGVEYKSSEVLFGSTITPEELPVKEGYTFSSWSEIPTTMPASDVTITGSFTINKYKLTYIVDGEEYKSSEMDYGTSITVEEAPIKEGYTFSGWGDIPETMPAGDVTIIGTFSVNKYMLTYNVDGVEYNSSEVDYGTTIIAEPNPTKEGCTFSGWSEIPTTMPANDVTVTGAFTVNSYTITYMVDNVVLTTEEVDYGSTITPPVSQKDGYEISWNSHPTTMPAYDITIYGSYVATGIERINADEAERQVFTPDGKRVQTPRKGLNLIRRSDGTTKKVVVK